jgi:Ca-activated chloride channel homolog
LFSLFAFSMQPFVLWGYTFAQPQMFWLLLVLPLLVYRGYGAALRRAWQQRFRAAAGSAGADTAHADEPVSEPDAHIRFSTLAGARAVRGSLGTQWRVYGRHVLFLLRVAAVVLVIIALARPQSSARGQNVETEGIDIVLAMDISGSMLAEDFRPNRIEAAKKVAAEFVDARPTDRIGLVVFSGESFTQCPLTTDHGILKTLFLALKSGMVADGTAIGMGLSNAVTRLKDSEAKSKVVILLTDGVNNSGSIAPLTAAEIAKAFGIRVYTIGVGTRGFAPYPVQTPFGIQYQDMEVQIDEEVMQQIATMTNGKYFRATTNTKLQEIYREIDQMEKTRILVTEFSRLTEEFFPFALAALMLFVAELVLRYTTFRGLP